MGPLGPMGPAGPVGPVGPVPHPGQGRGQGCGGGQGCVQELQQLLLVHELLPETAHVSLQPCCAAYSAAVMRVVEGQDEE